MKKYLQEYKEKIDTILKGEKIITKEMINEHVIKIQFFQHERLIHLLVTLFYALFVVASLALCAIHIIFLIVFFLLVCFLIPYIYHYFFLENNVQYLYIQYDKMLEKNNKKAS